MRNLLLAFIFCCLAPASRIHAETTPFDSIDALIPTLAGQERLNAYTTLHQLSQQMDMDAELSVIRRYLAEARSQHNAGEEAYVHVLRIQCYSNFYELDSMQTYLPSTLRYLEQHASWKFYYYCRSLLVESLLDAEQTESALREAKAIYTTATEHKSDVGIAFAYSCMAFTYQRMDRAADAADYARRALKIYLPMPDYGDRVLRLYDTLCKLLYRSDLPAEGLAEALNFNRFLDSSPHGNPFNRFYCHLDLALGYAMQQPARADSCLALAEAFAGDDFTLRANCTDIRMHVHYYTRRYASALDAANRLVCLNDSIGDHFSQISALESRIKILCALDSLAGTALATVPSSGASARPAAHYARLALADYARMTALNDSLRTAASDAQLNSLHTLYRVDALRAEARLQHLHVLLAVGGCLLLLAILTLYIRYSLRLRAKNRVLYQQIQEQLHRPRAERPAADAAPAEELSRGMLLVRDLEHLMGEEQLYAAPDIDRKLLASRLNTNERYLADAIRESTGLTVSAYITRLRLEHALRLIDGGSTLTMHAIAMDAGFTSYDPFLKAFVKVYGMTPTDYRKMAKSEAGS